MSSVSSGADIVVKYQRLSAEFLKVRNQVSVLKTALLDEQSKTAEFQRELGAKDAKLRKLTSENESLAFRNDQLVKRIETLQENLDGNKAAFALAKGKKKHKDANLRLFGDSSRQILGAGTSAASSPLAVVEQELERKIGECSELHSRIFDLEKQHDAVVNQFLERIDQLERDNTRIQGDTSGPSTSPKPSSSSAQKPAQVLPTLGPQNCGENKSSPHVNCCTENAQLKSKIFDLEREHEAIVSELTKRVDELEREQQSQSKVPAAVYFTPSEICPTTSPDHLLKGLKDCAADGQELSEFLTQKVRQLTASLQFAVGRAEYYKQECESLVRRNICQSEQNEELQRQIDEFERKCSTLKDELESTRTNYEAQMRGLYEHLASQDAKIVEQDERLQHGGAEVSAIPNGQGRAAGVVENGELNVRANGKNKKLAGWFSSSSSK